MFTLCNYSQTRFINSFIRKCWYWLSVGPEAPKECTCFHHNRAVTPEYNKDVRIKIYSEIMKSPSMFADDSYGFSLFTHISVISLSIPIRIGISFLKCFIFSRLCVHFYLLVRYQVNTINIKKLHVSVYVYFSLLVSYQANTINILQIVARKHINTISNITFCLLLSS